MMLQKKTPSRKKKKKFSLVLTEQLSELPDHLQLLISVFIFSSFLRKEESVFPR